MGRLSEAKEQRKLAQYLDLRFPGWWFHTPNGGVRDKSAAHWLKQEGVKSGVPDVLIIVPFHREGERAYRGVALELKVPPEGDKPRSRPSKTQREWLCAFRWADFYSVVVWGADEGIDLLERLYRDTPMPDVAGRTLKVCWTCMREVHPSTKVKRGRKPRSCLVEGEETCTGDVREFSRLADVVSTMRKRTVRPKAKPKTKAKAEKHAPSGPPSPLESLLPEWMKDGEA